jgi:hypothetical protein
MSRLRPLVGWDVRTGATATFEIPCGIVYHGIVYGNRTFTPAEFSEYTGFPVTIGDRTYLPLKYAAPKQRGAGRVE